MNHIYQYILNSFPFLAAWDFYNKHKASLSWDLAVINPPYVRPVPSFSLHLPLSLTTIPGLRCKPLPHLFIAFLSFAHLTSNTARHSRSLLRLVAQHLGPHMVQQRSERGLIDRRSCHGRFVLDRRARSRRSTCAHVGEGRSWW